MPYNNKDFNRILKETIFQTLFKEIESLREWYFFEPKHSIVNKEYYSFLDSIAKDGLSADERLTLAISTYRKLYQYMTLFYSQQNTVDIDLLTEDIASEGTMKPLKKRGRPKGSKNKPKSFEKGNKNNIKKEVSKKR